MADILTRTTPWPTTATTDPMFPAPPSWSSHSQSGPNCEWRCLQLNKLHIGDFLVIILVILVIRFFLVQSPILLLDINCLRINAKEEVFLLEVMRK